MRPISRWLLPHRGGDRPDRNPALPWTEQIKTLAHRLRIVLEAHPGVAGLLKTLDPISPHSLSVAEAILLPLHNAEFPHHDAGLAFFLILDYTIGFEVSNPRLSVNEQRVQDAVTRQRLHEFFRSLPADRFPTLVRPRLSGQSKIGSACDPDNPSQPVNRGRFVRFEVSHD